VVIPEPCPYGGGPFCGVDLLDMAEPSPRQLPAERWPSIELGILPVDLEPSSVSICCEEITNLLPHDKNLKRLYRQTSLQVELP